MQVTGFLGSGKTTLLNHVLKQKGQRRVAVIENEVRHGGDMFPMFRGIQLLLTFKMLAI